MHECITTRELSRHSRWLYIPRPRVALPLFRVSHLRGKRTQVVLRDGGGCNDMDTGVTEGRESNVPWRPGLSRDEQGAGHLPSSSESAKELSGRRAVLSAPFRTERTERAALLFSCPRQEFLAFLGVSTS